MFILFIILFLLYTPSYLPAQSSTKIINLSYPKGTSFLNSVAGRPIKEIRVQVKKGDRNAGNAKVLFRTVLAPKKSSCHLEKELVLTDKQGIAETALSGPLPKGDYVISASLPAEPYVEPVSIELKVYSSMWLVLVVIGLLGGLGMFLYGMKLGADGLQNVAGNKMKTIIAGFTTNPVLGLTVGILATAAVQSSSATSSMCVGFVSATLMTLSQSFSVMLGARIGTTITAQLIAFKIADYALLLVIAGFILLVSGRKKKLQFLGTILIGFGFIFFGMGVMSESMMPLRSYPSFTNALIALNKQPLLALLFSTLFTALIQSSGATVGLCMVFADQGLMDLNSAMPLAMGAIIGTTMTSILASLGANREGKRVAVANALFAILCCVVCFPFYRSINNLAIKVTLLMGTDSITRQVANAYTLLSIFGSVIFLPVLKIFEVLMLKIMPVDPETLKKFKPQYLQEGFDNSPDIALDLSKKEILRMGSIVKAMIELVPVTFEKRDDVIVNQVIKEDDKVDILDEAIRPYLNKMARGGLSTDQTNQYMAQLYFTNYLEGSGDIIVKNLMHQAGKLIHEDFAFSQTELDKLRDFNSKVQELFSTVMESFEKKDHELAERVNQLYMKLERIGKKIQQDHFVSLQGDDSQTISRSSVFLDSINGLLALAGQVNSMAKVIIEQL